MSSTASFTHQPLADLFKLLVTVSLAAIGFLFTIQSLAEAAPSPFYPWAVGLFGACVLSSLLGYIAIAGIALGERPRFKLCFFYPRFWFYAAWILFLLAVCAGLAIALSLSLPSLPR